MTNPPAPWLADAIAAIGRYNDGPDVPMLARQVGAAFPDIKDWKKAGPATAWCGIFVAAKLVKYGIRPPYKDPGDNVESWMYVDSWEDWGTAVPIGQEQPGDVAGFKSSDLHHVAFVAGNGEYVGGNQGDAVSRKSFPTPAFIRRPPPPSVDTSVPPIVPSDHFVQCVELLLVSEGGNDDDPNDPGGRTSRGILQREWDKWRTTHSGLPSDVWHAPQDQVIAIYRQNYWNVLQCDHLPAGVDYCIFDYGVNSGISRAAKVLQRIVGTDIDGEIGPLTIAATARADPIILILINQICDERMTFLRGLSTWGTFGNGWTARVKRVRADSLDMVGAIKPPVPEPPPPVHPPPIDPDDVDPPDLAAIRRELAELRAILESIMNQQLQPQPQFTQEFFDRLAASMRANQPPPAPPQPSLIGQIIKNGWKTNTGLLGAVLSIAYAIYTKTPLGSEEIVAAVAGSLAFAGYGASDKMNKTKAALEQMNELLTKVLTQKALQP